MAASATHNEAVAGRVAGFVGHLRLNDFSVGPAETLAALDLLDRGGIADANAARRGLKTLLTGCHEEWRRFDDLFEAYWFGRGRVRDGVAPTRERAHVRPAIWSGQLPDDAAGGTAPGSGEVSATGRGTGEGDAPDLQEGVVAARQHRLMRTDLRHLAAPAEIAEAERLALRLAKAMRYRLSRRRRIDAAGSALDFRRTIRMSVAQGGEPLRRAFRSRPDRPVRIVVLLDVSGSMKPYSRVFLQFVKGLVGAWPEVDAYLVHTKLVRVTDALKENDALKAMARLGLMAEGFGGGTRLGECLCLFNRQYARRALNSRSVVMIMSDGYDTGSAGALAEELKRLKRRARRVVWLNPMLGWRGYEPVTQAMAAALPLIDHFAAANTLAALSAIERDLARL